MPQNTLSRQRLREFLFFFPLLYMYYFLAPKMHLQQNTRWTNKDGSCSKDSESRSSMNIRNKTATVLHWNYFFCNYWTSKVLLKAATCCSCAVSSMYWSLACPCLKDLQSLHSILMSMVNFCILFTINFWLLSL